MYPEIYPIMYGMHFIIDEMSPKSGWEIDSLVVSSPWPTLQSPGFISIQHLPTQRGGRLRAVKK
jgi:hypothetical protein